MPRLPKNQFEKISTSNAIKQLRHSKWAKLYISEFNSRPGWHHLNNIVARVSFVEHKEPGDAIEDMLCAIPILRAIGFNIVMLSELDDCPYEIMRYDDPSPNKLGATGICVDVNIWEDFYLSFNESDNIPLNAYEASVAVPNACFEYIMDLLDEGARTTDTFEIFIEDCPGDYIDAVATIPKLMSLGLFVPVIDMNDDITHIMSFVLSTSPKWKSMYVI